ncbi:MAG: 50S ribosomal protein L29 [Planctomycetes bacterium]|nr:50S ribosomal protein L29 [Planctomycetota bacterium]
MQISEIREKETAALQEELASLEQTRLDIAIRAATEEGEARKLRQIRKDVARYKTVLSERKAKI